MYEGLSNGATFEMFEYGRRHPLMKLKHNMFSFSLVLVGSTCPFDKYFDKKIITTSLALVLKKKTKHYEPKLRLILDGFLIDTDRYTHFFFFGLSLFLML